MDPKATLALINDADLSYDERLEALYSLSGWIARGGMMPTDKSGSIMHPTLTDEALETLAENGFLASALNVALAYGDLTGLSAFNL